MECPGRVAANIDDVDGVSHRPHSRISLSHEVPGLKNRALNLWREARGWDFTALRNHERADEYPGTARGAYVVEGPEETTIETPETATETAQAELRGAGEVIVTFDPKVTEEFPSIRLLLPGDPLFDSLVSMIPRREGDEVAFVCGYEDAIDAEQVTVETASKETNDAEVILPAVPESSQADLPEGTSLPDITEAESVVRDWLNKC